MLEDPTVPDLEQTDGGTRQPPAVIDVALSGGGFRATLFHLGVIGFLRDENLLGKVVNICSVSGGSILAADLVMKWSAYTSPDACVSQRAIEALANQIKERDISAAVMRRSKRNMLRFRPLDSEQLVVEYGRMFGGPTSASKGRRKTRRWFWNSRAGDGTLAHSDPESAPGTISSQQVTVSPVPSQPDSAKPLTPTRWEDLEGRVDLPSIYILATHLNTGTMCVFSAEGFSIFAGPQEADAPITGQNRDEIEAFAAFARATNIKGQDIARAVAASSAFPPVFSPLAPVATDAGRLHLLTDGGVYDNSGVNYLRAIYEERCWANDPTRLVIVSDAGRAFSAEANKQYTNLFALAMRVADAQGNLIAESDSKDARRYFERQGIDVLHCSIHEPVKHDFRPPNHSTTVQKRLAAIRTELDSFTDQEVFVLYRHGYLVARQAYAGYCQKRCVRRQVSQVVLDPWAPGRDTVGTLNRTDLEAAIKDSDSIDKLTLLAKCCFYCAIVAAILLLGIGIALGANAWPWLREVMAQEPTGTLSIADFQAYTSGWADRLPILNAVLSRQYPVSAFEFTSQRLGNLTSQLDHRQVYLTVEFTGQLRSPDVEIFLFMVRKPRSRQTEFIALQADEMNRFIIPPGEPSDHIRGLVVTKMESDKYPESADIILTLETP